MKIRLFYLFISALILCPLPCSGLESVDKKPIVLGQSCALSGPVKNLGLEMRAGLLAAFSQINDNGGIRGREIVLISQDDGYEPDEAVKNTNRLIYDDQAFALIGAVGTPTSLAVAQIINDSRIPFIAPFTGAEFLRKPFKKYVINVRASYYQEMEKLTAYLVDNKKFSRIACFYQNDSYGFAGLKGIEIALARRGMQLVSKGSYERNTVAVLGGLEDIAHGKPEAIVLVGAYSACAEFIKLNSNRTSRELTYCNISFVGTESLKEALGGYGANVVVSQVVPSPNDIESPFTRQFLRAMKMYQHDAAISFTSLEGYLGGRLFGAIARAVEGELTRENFIETMETVSSFDLDGIVLSFGSTDHQGLDTVYLTEIYPVLRKLHEDI